MSAGLVPWVLGAAWGLVLAIPVVRRARRTATAARAAALGGGGGKRASGRARRFVTPVRVLRAHVDDPGIRVVTAVLRRRRAHRSEADVRRELPIAIDLLGVAVGAGCTPYLAVDAAARWLPERLARELRAVLRSCALGLDFASALDAMARSTPTLRPLTDALLASDRLGVPVGPVLARLADEDRRALRRDAEAHARRIPVRLLFPLVFLVLPAFVLLTVVPGVAAGLGRL